MQLIHLLMVNAGILSVIFLVLLLSLSGTKSTRLAAPLKKVKTQALRTHKNDFRSIRDHISVDSEIDKDI